MNARAKAERHHWRHHWRHRWRHSLRARLITVFLLLALGMGAVFIGGMRSGFVAGWRNAGLPLVADYVDRLAAEIGSPPDVGRARALTERLPIAIRIEGPTVNWDSMPDRAVRERHDRSFGRAGSDAGANGPDRVLRRITQDGHRIDFSLDATPLREPSHGVGWITLALLLALVLAAYAYVRRLLRPLDDIRAGAERFGAGRFDAPIPVRRRDQLGDLAARINTMAHDIEAMLDAKRALLLALSHELRSPLTRARLNAELLPDTPEGIAERAALLRDLGLMRDLIADLIESERLASPHAALQREGVDLAALVREVVAGHADGAGVALDLASDLTPMPLDRLRMRLLLRNLLDNALRHGGSSPNSEPVRITLRGADAGGVLLSVRDFGPGVDEAQLAHLTEPFFRTDSARGRATGGVGLGMTLCRLVAEAHGGRLMVRNAQPGLEVQVLLNQ